MLRGYHYVTAALAAAFPFFIFLRTAVLKKARVKAVHFGKRDKKDFIIIPCMAFFYYMIAAQLLKLPAPGYALYYRYFVHWYGSAACFIGLLYTASAVITMGACFRIGLDGDGSLRLVTTGPFAMNRNPIYTGMLFMFAGVFITYANWIFIVYFIVGLGMIHRQILREEKLLAGMHGDAYAEYRKKVRRYF